jgi:transposase
LVEQRRAQDCRIPVISGGFLGAWHARTDDRKIINAIFYVLRTGMPWRDLPERYGPYTTPVIASTAGLVAAFGNEFLYLIDSMIVKAHRAASGR